MSEQKHDEQQKPHRVIEIIITRALTDADFRDRLFQDRETALREYDLTDADREVLARLDRQTLNDTQEVASIVGATCSAYAPEE